MMVGAWPIAAARTSSCAKIADCRICRLSPPARVVRP